MDVKSNDEYCESDIKVKIQKTLVSINQITLNIQNELGRINNLVKKNGEFHSTIVDANETLIEEAEKMGLDIANILNKDGNEDKNEMELNLKSALSSTSFKKKISTCLNNI